MCWKCGLEIKPSWAEILWILTSVVVSDVVVYYVCINPYQGVFFFFRFHCRLALLLEVRLLTGCVFSSFSPAEYVAQQSPAHPGCPRTNHWEQHHLSKRGPVGFRRAQRVRPRWEGHGQRLPGPHLHPLLHGVFDSVSLSSKLAALVPIRHLLLSLRVAFCVQAVLQFLQDWQHGQRYLHLVPAAMVGWRHLQPGGLLPGRPAPAAGERQCSCDSRT